MKFALPIILVVVTAALMALALTGVGHAHGTVGIAAGSAMYGLTPKATTPEQALTNLLVNAERRNWDLASRGYVESGPRRQAEPLSMTGPDPTAACARFQILKGLKPDRCTSPMMKRKCASICIGQRRSVRSKMCAIFI